MHSIGDGAQLTRLLRQYWLSKLRSSVWQRLNFLVAMHSAKYL